MKRFSSEELMFDVQPEIRGANKTTCECTQCTNNTPNNASAGQTVKKPKPKSQQRSRDLALLQRQMAGVAVD